MFDRECSCVHHVCDRDHGGFRFDEGETGSDLLGGTDGLCLCRDCDVLGAGQTNNRWTCLDLGWALQRTKSAENQWSGSTGRSLSNTEHFPVPSLYSLSPLTLQRCTDASLQVDCHR